MFESCRVRHSPYATAGSTPIDRRSSTSEPYARTPWHMRFHVVRRTPEGQIRPIPLFEWHRLKMYAWLKETSREPTRGPVKSSRFATPAVTLRFVSKRISGCVCFAGHLPVESRSRYPAILICPPPVSVALPGNLLTPWVHQLSETKGRFTTDRRAHTSVTAVQSSSHHINAA